MTAITNTFTTSNAVGNREDLSDVVSRVAPEDTPIYSMIKKEKARSIYPEWEIDTLGTPATNAAEEGDEFSFGTIDPPKRAGNYTQIFRKTWVVSQTQESVDNAGMVEQVKYQQLKKGIELRKDVEFALVSNVASASGTTRKLGGLPTWYTTNTSRGTRGANGGFNKTNNNAKVTATATAGTNRDFTKEHLDGMMQKVYNNGGTVKFAVCSPYVKSVFTTFMSSDNVASFRYAASEGGKNTIIATADVYEGDFGKVMIVPNRVQATSAVVASNVHLLDPDLLSFKALRRIQNVKDIAKTGDAKKGVIIGEGTLCVRNEKGLGVIADIKGRSTD